MVEAARHPFAELHQPIPRALDVAELLLCDVQAILRTWVESVNRTVGTQTLAQFQRPLVPQADIGAARQGFFLSRRFPFHVADFQDLLLDDTEPLSDREVLEVIAATCFATGVEPNQPAMRFCGQRIDRKSVV